MLKGILDFFRNLFSGLFGGGQKTPKTPTPPTSTTPPPVVNKPAEEETTTDSGRNNSSNTETPTTTIPTETNETIDPIVTTPSKEEVTPSEEIQEEPIFDPQDGSEIPPDSTEVVIVEDLEPIIPDPEIVLPEVVVGEDTSTTTPTENKPAHTPRYMWCLDNGHGSKTAGKRSPKLPNGDQLLEYRFNRDIVKRISDRLKIIGVEHYIVVPEIDTDNFLEGRVSRSNKKKSNLPKLFVSVHANAAPAPPGRWCNPSISGIETWYYHNSRRGRKLATVFQNHLIEKTGFKNRFIKSRPSNQFFVLRKTGMTAVLTENGFYNNKAQCIELLKDKVREEIAEAHVAAILEVEKRGL